MNAKITNHGGNSTYILFPISNTYLLPTTYLSNQNMAPRTPSPRPSRRQEADTIRKACFFWHAVDKRQNKSLITVIKEKEIPQNTGFR